MRSLRTTPAALACVYISIVNLIDDSARHGTMSHRLIRVFPTNPLLRFNGLIHECLGRVDGSEMAAVLAPITILHKGYTGEMLTVREKDARNKPLISAAYESERRRRVFAVQLRQLVDLLGQRRNRLAKCSSACWRCGPDQVVFPARVICC